jgi:cysteine-rich repeat protein
MRWRLLLLSMPLLSSCSVLAALLGAQRCDSEEITLIGCEVGERAILCEDKVLRKHQCDIQEVCIPFEESRELNDQPQNFDGCGLPLRCGDGRLDIDDDNIEESSDEECDDGNGVDTDACRSNCRINVCGDGVINFADGDSDGVSDENCEPPGVGNCSADCTLGCQDAQDCNDDPNILANLGCIEEVSCQDLTCVLRPLEVPPDVQGDCVTSGCFANFGVASVLLDDNTPCNVQGGEGLCFEGVCRTPGNCGNGITESIEGEQCDDSNQNNDDSCDNDCRVNCILEPGDPFCGCGNGVVDPGEGCDDNNQINNDLCTNQCQVAACADGILQPLFEQCDDANLSDDDGCSANCLIELCGDNLAIGGELCDGSDLREQRCDTLGFHDGILGCSADCQTFDTGDCVFLVSCGDGTVQPGEDCDDANTDNTDACPDTCQAARCGDGFEQANVEQCDDGAGNSDFTPNACRTDCTDPRCGDNIIDAGEQCDDANTVPNDGCDNCIFNATGTCTEFEVITLGNAFGDNRDTTINFTTEHSGGCFTGTQENIFMLRLGTPLADTDNLSILISPNAGVDLGFYLRRRCDSPQDEVLCKNDFGAGQQENATITGALLGNASRELFLFVDTAGTAGGYSLTISRF